MSSFDFPPTVLPQIDQAIQQGLGAVAQVLGQAYTVYRLSTATNQSVVSGTPIYTHFPCSLRRITSKVAIENEIFSLLCYVATCNNQRLQLGDVLVETGYEAQEGAAFTFAQERPTAETLMMRTSFPASITRPTPGAGNPAQQPASGFSFVDAYGGAPGANDSVLALNAGVYSFAPSYYDDGGDYDGGQMYGGGVVPATVMCDLQQLNRVHAAKDLGTPTDQPEARFLCYIPPLGGEQIQEFDRVKLQNGDSYQVDSLYPATAGLVGTICLCVKRGAA